MTTDTNTAAEKVVESLDPLDGISLKTAASFMRDNGREWAFKHTRGSVGAMASNDTMDAPWIADVVTGWKKWLEESDNGARWVSIAACWNEYVEKKDGYISSKIDCVCRLSEDKFASANERKRVISSACNCNDSGILRATIYLIKDKDETQ